MGGLPRNQMGPWERRKGDQMELDCQRRTQPFWGSYSNTCCKVSKVMDDQLKKAMAYNATCGGLQERPLLQLYWTLTPQAQNEAADDGSRYQSLREAAEV